MSILTKCGGLSTRMVGLSVAAATMAVPTLAMAAPASTASSATRVATLRAARIAAPAAKKSKLGGAPIGIVATVGIIAGAAGLIYLATKSGNDPFELGDSN